MLALLNEQGQVTQFPYSYGQWAKSKRAQGVSVPDQMPTERMAEEGMVLVIRTERPQLLPYQTLKMATIPTLNNGYWEIGWVIEETPLAQYRQSILRLVDAQYENRMVSGIVYQGLQVQSSDRAVINIIGANRNPNASRKNVIGGQPVTITSQMAAALEVAITAYTDALGERRYDLYVAISEAVDHAALALIDSTSGWPSNVF